MKPVPVIHIHIPKTAGSTINSILQTAFKQEESFICGSTVPGLTHFQSNLHFVNLPDDEKLKYRFIAGHVEFMLVQSYPAEHFSFTFLRNPVSRINSMYHYIKQNKNHHLNKLMVENDMSMESFCRGKLWHEIDNGICRKLSGVADSIPYGRCTADVLHIAKHNLTNNISFFGLQKRFNESIFLLLYFLDALDLLEYKKANVTKVKKKVAALTEQEIQVITEFNAYDLELYAYAWELYMSRHERLRTALAKPLAHYAKAMTADN